MRVSDRRTWHYLDAKSTIYKSVWIKDLLNAQLSEIEEYSIIENDMNSILIKNNNLPLSDLMEVLGIPLKRKWN